jgi:hypothetical protein
VSPPIDKLSLLALAYRSDKFVYHLYTPEYDRLFAPLRGRAIRLLEIGVGGYEDPLQGGASLRMWADYFPNGRIVGLDLHPKSLDLPDHAVVRQGSQTDPEVLDRLWQEDGPFDIVIDDGSHAVDHVLATFRHLYPRLPDGGLYVVEDTQTAFMPGFGGNPTAAGTIVELAHRIVLGMHRLEVEAGGQAAPDHPFGAITHGVEFLRNLIVFRRGDNTFPSNLKFDPAHPRLAAISAALEALQRQEPSVLAFFAQCQKELMLQQSTQAALAAARGLAAFPGDPDLLAALAAAVQQPLNPPRTPKDGEAAAP